MASFEFLSALVLTFSGSLRELIIDCRSEWVDDREASEVDSVVEGRLRGPNRLSSGDVGEGIVVRQGTLGRRSVRVGYCSSQIVVSV